VVWCGIIRSFGGNGESRRMMEPPLHWMICLGPICQPEQMFVAVYFPVPWICVVRYWNQGLPLTVSPTCPHLCGAGWLKSGFGLIVLEMDIHFFCLGREGNRTLVYGCNRVTGDLAHCCIKLVAFGSSGWLLFPLSDWSTD